MTENEYYLTCLAEELNETAHRILKSLRFTLDEIEPGQPHDNANRVMRELFDVMALVDICAERGLLPRYTPQDMDAAILVKKVKVANYLGYARQCGSVTD